MKDYARIKERFLRDPVPRRLGALAADLARIGSIASQSSNGDAVTDLIEEARRFVEWTAAETDIETAAELVDIQLSLTLWLAAWPEARTHASLRSALGHSALCWSERVLALSGLLERSSSAHAAESR